MNRKQFIQSHGATCKNWNWSWSFINKSKRTIIFGAWDLFTTGKMAMILGEDWIETWRGQKAKGYNESRENVRLIEEEGYKLMTFPMESSDELGEIDRSGPVKIKNFTPLLTEKKLIKIKGAWYAADESDATVTLAEEIITPQKYVEGVSVTVTINAYERSAKARAACLNHYGHVCAVCGFNFVKIYGTLGEGFIHVHHIVPIGEVKKEYKVDPLKDLIPVCPNCHAMIHRTEPPLTVDQLRNHIREISGRARFTPEAP